MNEEAAKRRVGLTEGAFRIMLLILVVLPWGLIWFVTLPSDVLEEVKSFRDEMRKEIKQEIQDSTADRFKGQDFLDFTDANSELTVPPALKEKLSNGEKGQ